jgi:hypothetical protein
LILLTAIVGVGFILLAIKAAVFWDWNDIFPQAFLDAGIALLLAAALFLIQRRFMEKVWAVQTAMCSPADPPAPITQYTRYGGLPPVWRYWGHDPRHQWDLLTGRRVEDFKQPPDTGRPRLPVVGE